MAGGLFKVDSAKLDSSLTSLFGQSAGPISRPVKQKVDLDLLEAQEAQENESESSEEEEVDESEEAEQETEEAPAQKVSKPSKRKREEAEEKELDDIENRYMQKLLDDKDEKVAEEEEESDEDEDSKDSKISEPSALIHESLVHESLLNNTEVDKAESTVFIGNLPSIVITEKQKFKELKALLASKGGKIKSVRFRSIAFSEMLPRKAAFVKHKFHSSRETVNAYAVYDSAENARSALALNGTVFEDHHLRVDSIAHPGKQDNKRSIFVGNLDFEIDEEPLWQHFSSCGDIEYVRIVRDSKTNVGKGFGYVQFADPVAVTKALLLDSQPLGNPKGRKLRISRSKNIRKPMEKPGFPAHRGHSNIKKPRLTNEEKTKLGRAKSVLGKAGRAEINSVLEGTRAVKGENVRGNRNGGKRKKPRIRERTTNFKRQMKAAAGTEKK